MKAVKKCVVLMATFYLLFLLFMHFYAKSGIFFAALGIWLQTLLLIGALFVAGKWAVDWAKGKL